MSSQEAVLRFLRDPASYPTGASPPEIHSTHGSWVFLAGDLAYKLKKEIDLGWMDYSTPEKRRRFSELEVELNRRLAPGIYLGVRAILESAGRLGFGKLREPGEDGDFGAAREIDTVVVMKRLPREVMLDHLLETGGAGDDEIARVVDLLAAFEGRAARGLEIDRGGAPETLRRSILENSGDIAKLEGDLLSAETAAALRSAQLTFVEVRRGRIENRLREGRVRDGHGDIRAEHVVFLPEPAVMDCVEFNERFRHIDVAADIAFLRMDLEFLGHERLARSFVDRFIDATGDSGMQAVLELHITYRACVRGKVDGIKSRQDEVDPAERERAAMRSRRYFDLALAHARLMDPPLLVLVGGLSGSGKSTTARLLGERLGTTPIRSDVIRKELAGLGPTARPPDEAGRAALYAPEMSRRTYEECAARAGRLLAAGGAAIIDATFLREADRVPALECARRTGARLVYLECRAPPDVAALRLRKRDAEGGDPSDATADVLDRQRRSREEPRGAAPVPIETSGPPEQALESALDAIRAKAGA